MSMAEPLIGITTGYVPEKNSDRAQQVVNHDYVAAVAHAGGCPVLLPMTDRPDTVRPLLGLLDGLIITGGPGIVDGLVGELPADLSPVASIRHLNDLLAFRIAQANEIPILGICYGMQFINARFGGTLYADVQEQCGCSPHSPKRTHEPIIHGVTLQDGTHLAKILGGGRCETNSYHLQAVEKIGPGLRINAWASDGVIEGLETEDGGVMGVQFHPEKMPGTPFDHLFAHLVVRARQANTKRASRTTGVS
jgi:putative glutamine amidotransferase